MKTPIFKGNIEKEEPTKEAEKEQSQGCKENRLNMESGKKNEQSVSVYEQLSGSEARHPVP